MDSDYLNQCNKKSKILKKLTLALQWRERNTYQGNSSEFNGRLTAFLLQVEIELVGHIFHFKSVL